MTFDQEVFRISGHRVRVFAGDLAGLPETVDALVSSDDNYLSRGVGLSLWRRAGRELEEFVEQNRPQLRLGDAWPSPAFKLNAQVLVHAISIDLDQNRTLTEADLPGLYLRLFETLAARKCARVGLPLIGAGEVGIAPRASAAAFADALTSGFPGYAGVVDFILAIHSQSDRKAIEVLRAADRREREIEETLGEVISWIPGDASQTLKAAWHQYVNGDPEARGPALALLWGHVSDLQERFPGLTDPAVAERLTRDTNLLRNRIAHSRTGTSAHDWANLLSSVRDSLARTVTRLHDAERGEQGLAFQIQKPVVEEPSFSLAAADPPGPQAHRSRGSEQPTLGLGFGDAGSAGPRKPPPNVSSTPATKPDAELPSARGGAPLRELRDFIVKHLSPEALGQIYERLEGEGYHGPQELQLLEFLVREPDLVELVASEFGNTPLRAAIVKYRGEQPPSFRTASKLAGWFLKSLGFPQPIRPSGLKAVRNAVRSAEAQLLRNNDAALRGAVAEVAQRLEDVCRVMLRFISQAAYRKAPELLFREWEKLEEGETLATAGLGKLVILVESLNSRLQRDNTPEVQLFTRDIAKGPLFPPDVAELAKLRNSFSHYQQQQTSTAVAKQAKDFLGSATKFLEYLDRADGRIFPHIVLIEGVHYDRWGRRVIEMVDDEGVREVLFTDDPIGPGETYFMHPLTNPLRVDPILVPAGDLLWLDT